MSWQSHVVNLGLRVRGSKVRGSSARRTRAKIERLARRPASHAPPRFLGRGVAVTERRVAGTPVYTVKPRGEPPNRCILYLHGGSYTYEISPFHWRLVRFLARAVPARVEVPIYPLAPRATAAETVPAMADLVEGLIHETGSESVTVMGDSAGGGMSLAVAQVLRDRAAAQPARLVLISPWLDVTTSDPRQRRIEPRDRMLGIEGLAESGRCYAGGLDVRDPRVSPLFGDLRGLAPIVVFSGTNDILNTDARALVERAREAGAEIEYHEAPGMQHVYPILPLIPEGRAARRLIARLVRG